MYLPLINDGKKPVIFKIRFKWVFLFASFLPTFSFLACIILTMLKDFESANHTHCDVYNVFPSVSATIGNYFPQNLIWRIAIYVHCLPRMLTVYLRFQYYVSSISKEARFLVFLAVLLNTLENLSLVGLTYWTSSANYPFHEKCFETFVISSILYMFLICWLLRKCRKNLSTLLERRSLSLKWRFLAANVIAVIFSVYFFWRHNTYCEPFVYSLFGLSEYVVVTSNMAFHMTTIYDFNKEFVVFSKNAIFLSS